MIDLKIRMISGKEYKIRNFECNNLKEFTRIVLKAVTTNWYEVLPSELIQISLIESLELIVEEKEIEDPLELDDKEEIILPQDKVNEDIENNDVPEKDDIESTE